MRLPQSEEDVENSLTLRTKIKNLLKNRIILLIVLLQSQGEDLFNTT